MSNRFSNPIFYIALISLIYTLLDSYLTRKIPPEELIINLILNILIGAGVISDYKDRRDK